MPKPTITIPLDPETARAYDLAAPEKKRQMEALLALWLRELASAEYPALQEILSTAGQKAKARGLTPEILDTILKGAWLRFVFDTNVLVSALLISDSVPNKAFAMALEEGTLLLSFSVLSELYAVLTRPHFRRYVDEEDTRNFVAALTREAEWLEVVQEIKACRDPKDDKFLELAVAGRATHIISGDSDLLALTPFRGIEIVSPSAFLQSPR
jgi:putative PIN family toxin of toxin-antitoxin system